MLLYLVVIIQLILCILGENRCDPKSAVWNTENPAAPFYTQEICDKLYAYGNGFYIGMFLVSDTGVMMVDAPISMWPTLPLVVATVTPNPITTVIYSHHHNDHIGGASQIPNIENAEIICHQKTDEEIAESPDILKGVPRCTTTLDLKNQHKVYKIKDGNQEVLITYAGYRWHTNNDLFIFAPKQRTIMTVDMVFPGWIPFKNLGMATGVSKYRDAHDYLLSITSDAYGDWINYIGGHMDRIGTRDDVEKNAQYYDDLVKAAHSAETSIEFGAYVAKHFPSGFDGSNTWDIFRDLLNARAEECNRIMEDDDHNWGAIFKGYDAWGTDNCWWVVENLSVKIS